MKLIKDTEFLVIDFETITPKGRSPEPIEVGIYFFYIIEEIKLLCRE